MHSEALRVENPDQKESIPMSAAHTPTSSIEVKHPWTRSYPPELRWDSVIRESFVHHLLDEAAAAYAHNIAIEFEGRNFTFLELRKLADRAARGLQRLGVKHGVHVGLYLPNTPHYFVAFFAVLKAGGTVVNYSPLDAEKVVQHKIEDSETDILITLDLASLYPLTDKMLRTTRLKYLVVGNMAEMMPKSEAKPAAAHWLERSEIAWDERRVSFQELTDNDGVFEMAMAGTIEETIAVLQYTGGTTGMPKGAMLTHGNLSAASSQAVLNTGGANGLQPGKERFLSVLPLFHIYALTFNMLLGIRIAATNILHARFDPERALRELDEKRITVFFGVPTMFTALSSFPGIERFGLKSLRYCNSGGAPLPQDVSARFHKLTGCDLLEGWGMTEVSGIGTSTPRGADSTSAACGIPLCGVDIRFLDVNDPDRYVEYGERGEICIAGPNVMKGYWKNPEATRESMTADGFLRTGDVGYMDENGFLYIVDRIKDMILCSGYNVYPRNIEEAIYRHPSVAEVIVIGIDDAYRGQAPKAFIRLKDGAPALTLDELRSFLKDALGKHEMVQAIEIRDALPKTAVGKLSKKELYEEGKGKPPAFAAGSAPLPSNHA